MRKPFAQRLFERLYRSKLDSDFFLPYHGDFSYVMSSIKNWADFAEFQLDRRARIELLDFLIEAVKEDLGSSAAAEVIYTPLGKKTRDWRQALYFARRAGAACAETVRISSAGNKVIISPYDQDKVFFAIRSILDYGFRADYGTYDGAFYPELKLIAVSNGLHHAWVAAQLRQEGEYKVDVYKLEDMFPTIYTDGEFWYNRERPDLKEPVLDVRMAILYELARMRREAQ